MCEHGQASRETDRATDKQFDNRKQYEGSAATARESHMVYELKQKREYHIRQLVDIQKAIDAVSQVSSLY